MPELGTYGSVGAPGGNSRGDPAGVASPPVPGEPAREAIAELEGAVAELNAVLALQEGRDYEPASVLLERIRAENERQPAQPKRGCRRQ